MITSMSIDDDGAPSAGDAVNGGGRGKKRAAAQTFHGWQTVTLAPVATEHCLNMRCAANGMANIKFP